MCQWDNQSLDKPTSDNLYIKLCLRQKAKYIIDGITHITGDISKIFVSKDSKNPSDNVVISYISELDWRGM
jgi:hypothetical protein